MDQAAQLIRQAAKAGPRRFAADPVAITGFGPLDADQIVKGIREMRDPTHEQMRGLISAIGYRFELMRDSGHYSDLDPILQALDEANDLCEGVVCRMDGEAA